MRFTAEDQNIVWERWKHGDAHEAVALEFYRNAPDIDDVDAFRYADTWRMFSRTDNQYQYDALINSFRDKLTLAEKLNFCLKACCAEEKEIRAQKGINEENLLGTGECTVSLLNNGRFWELSEPLSKNEANMINTLVKNIHPKGTRHFKEAIYPQIKNAENLPSELRANIADYFIQTANRKELKDLKPQFHTLQTLQETPWYFSDAIKLSAVFEHMMNNPAQYYAAVGKNTGAMPETFVERFEKMWDALQTRYNPNTQRNEQVLPEKSREYIKRQMVLKDIAARPIRLVNLEKMVAEDEKYSKLIDSGKSPKDIAATLMEPLNPNDSVSALLETGAWQRERLLSGLRDEDICVLRDGLHDFHPDSIQAPKMKALENAIYVKYLSAEERTPEELKNATFRLKSLAMSKSAKVRKQALSLLKKTAQAYADKKDPKSEAVISADKADEQELRKERFKLDVLTDACTLYNAVVKARDFVQSAWPKDQAPADWNQLFTNALDGKEVPLEAPKIKIPLLFGKNEAKEKQERLNNAVVAFKVAVKNISQGHPENPQEKWKDEAFYTAVRKELVGITAISPEDYQNLINKKNCAERRYENHVNARSSRCGVIEAERKLQELNRDKEDAKRNFDEAENEAKRVETSLAKTRSRLENYKSKTQTETIGRNGSVVKRETEVPSAQKGKNEKSRKRYQDFKAAVKGRYD